MFTSPDPSFGGGTFRSCPRRCTADRRRRCACTIGGSPAMSPCAGEMPGSRGSCSPTYLGAHSAAIDGMISGSRVCRRPPSMSIARSAHGQIKPIAAGAGIPRSRRAMANANVSPATRRIANNDNAFRLDPVVDQRSIDRDHLLQRNRIPCLRRPRVVGHQRRHPGRVGQPRRHAAIALGATQRIRAAVQVQQRRGGVHPQRSHPLHRHTRDGDARRSPYPSAPEPPA